MTNIRCKGGKEIDLLAIDPVDSKKFHVEASVGTSPSFKVKEKDTYTSKGVPRKIGLDYFQKQKFEHPKVRDKVREFFGDAEDYKRILVVWDVASENVFKRAKNFGFDIWLMDELLTFLLEASGTKGARDDILRTVELMALMKRRKAKPERIESIEKEGKQLIENLQKVKKWRVSAELLVKDAIVICKNCGYQNDFLAKNGEKTNSCKKCGEPL
jgi:predicted Zn-ribbon and HTH transcriptional regulator